MPVTPFRLRQAARVVRLGGVIAYPTEAVYGLGCDPLGAFAVERLLRLKGRSFDKGLILISDRLERLRPFLAPVPDELERFARSTWPGPVTWLWPANPDCPWWLTGGRHSIAVRVTAHALAAALCALCEAPLVSTSANITGVAPARSPLQVRRRLRELPDFVLAGALGGSRRPTAIRDLLSGRVVRPA